MKIAVFGFYNSLNAGDDRLQYCITKLLVHGGHRVVFLPHSEDPPINYLRRFDWILIGGGGLVFSIHGIWKGMKRWIRKSRSRVGVIGLGVNRVDEELGKELSDLVELSEFVFVRDTESKKLLNNISKVAVYPDLTWVAPFNLETCGKYSKERFDVALNLAPCAWRKYDPIAWYESVKNFRVAPFPMYMTESQDMGLLESLMDTSVPKDFTLRPLLESRMLLACRYHAIVFALMNVKPFLAIAYDYKVSRLCDEIGLSELCLSTEEHFRLPDRMEYLESNYDVVKNRILLIRNEFIQKTDEMLRELNSYIPLSI